MSGAPEKIFSFSGTIQLHPPNHARRTIARRIMNQAG